MRLLLDTNALIWLLTEPARLSPVARNRITPAEQEIAVSLVSLWEMAIKISRGNLVQVGSSIQDTLEEMKTQNLQLLPISTAHLLVLERLPWLHKDPFDRLILAQAVEEKLTVVTSDRIFSSYSVAVLW